MARRIHQIMPGFLPEDAIGNHAFRLRALFRQWGYESQVYAQFRDSRLSDPGLDYLRYEGDPNNILIFHYSVGSPVTEFVRRFPDQVVLYYHNITPSRFVAGSNPEFAALLDQGRQDLPAFRNVRFVLAGSEYNRQELLALGFEQVEVLPYFIPFDQLAASAQSSAGQSVVSRFSDGWVNWLFVGRIVPNKCQADVIRAFRYYHQLINPRSRLWLIGSDVNAPGYRLSLEVLAEELSLSDVHWLGEVPLEAGFGAYYQAATVYVSMSEHEGFGVPLLEAMSFDIPVLAYDAAAVPYVLGQAGVLVNQKRYDVIGELVDLLASDGEFRRRVIACQRARLADFAPQAVEAQLRQLVTRWVE